MIRLLHRRWRHRQGRSRCREQLRQLRLLVLDVDGVLTDGGLWTTETGEVLKRFDVRDGLGIRLLQQAGLEVAWLSGGKSGATEQRARYLGIRHVLTGVRDKPAALAELQGQLGVSAAESEEYFRSRPVGSRLGAWASEQSKVVGEGEVRERLEQVKARFGVGDDMKEADIPLPDFWGGWRVVPE